MVDKLNKMIMMMTMNNGGINNNYDGDGFSNVGDDMYGWWVL